MAKAAKTKKPRRLLGEQPARECVGSQGGYGREGDCMSDALSKFLTGYLVAALWSETDDAGNPLGDRFGIADLPKETRAKAMDECYGFVNTNAGALALAYKTKEGYGPASAGHDFWLTRNGHGVGFWDRGLGAVGGVLTNAAQSRGSRSLYVGDDGKLYFD